MADTVIRQMTSEDEYFVSTCGHVGESEEADACGARRLRWLREQEARGARSFAALVEGRHAGFAYLLPIEISPWGPLGSDLAVLPCLCVQGWATGRGLGGGLVAAAEDVARSQGARALVIATHNWDFWFMPTTYFSRLGYRPAATRGNEVLLWKAFRPDAVAPRPLEPVYRYEPVPGRVVVDLFWHTFCQTSDTEAQRARDVAAEFGDAVVLREYSADDQETLERYQTPRAIYVNGCEVFWGYEAAREGLREAIALALRGEDPTQAVG